MCDNNTDKKESGAYNCTYSETDISQNAHKSYRENYGHFLQPLSPTEKSMKDSTIIELNDFAESVADEEIVKSADILYHKYRMISLVSLVGCLTLCAIGCIASCNRPSTNLH